MNLTKIPVWLAVLINVNIVVGSAFFIGASDIAHLSGQLAPFCWLLYGCLLIPLVVAFASLSRLYPTAGGMYVYSTQLLGKMWGFLSGWGYYIGTAVGNAIVIHAIGTMLHTVPATSEALTAWGLHPVVIDMIGITIFSCLNLLNIEFFERLQIGFSVLKCIPFLLVIVSVPFLFKVSNITQAPIIWGGLFNTMPFVLFAYIGVEACCAIADKIENGKQNAYKAIILSCISIIALYTIFQGLILAIQPQNQHNVFLGIIPLLTDNQTIVHVGNSLIQGAIIVSCFGGFYGMFYFNNWNLYAMANERSIVGSSMLAKMNKHQSPWICVITQALIIVLFLLFSPNVEYLVVISNFGILVAYSLSALAFIKIRKSFSSLLALVSCGGLLYISCAHAAAFGIALFLPFLGVMLLGVLAHMLQQRKT